MGAKQHRKKSVLLRMVLLLFCVYMLVSLGKVQADLVSSRKKLAEETETRDELSIKVAEIKSLLENGEEADFIERAARDKLGYVYSNEQVYVDLAGN